MSNTKEVDKGAGSRSTKAPERKGAEDDAPDALALLTADHEEVDGYFKQYAKLVKSDADNKELLQLAGRICQALSVHAELEEELFYPLMREQLDDKGLIDEANIEHGSLKELIAQINASKSRDGLLDARVKVLGEYVSHHVKEEEGQIFPRAKKLKLDLGALGERMAARKGELSKKAHGNSSGVKA